MKRMENTFFTSFNNDDNQTKFTILNGDEILDQPLGQQELQLDTSSRRKFQLQVST